MPNMSKIGTHKTAVYTNADAEICVVYHKTTVVRFDFDHIYLDSDGYRSVTTKVRMNQTSNQFALEFGVFQKDFDWYVSFDGDTYEFHDGMRLNRTTGVVDVGGRIIQSVEEAA